MQWVANAVSSLFSEYPAPQATGPLQREGDLTKEQLLRFFAAGQQLLDKPDVKQQLKQASASGQDLEAIITGLQEKLFESQGVEGKFGISFLGRVYALYKDEAELIAKFYEYVESEEGALDEAELPPDMWKLKKQAKEQKKAFAEKLKQMPPEEQQRYMQQQKQMSMAFQAQQQAMAEKLQNMTPAQQQAFMLEQQQRALEQMKGSGMADSTMTPEQQMHFFQSLRPPGPSGQ